VSGYWTNRAFHERDPYACALHAVQHAKQLALPIEERREPFSWHSDTSIAGDLLDFEARAMHHRMHPRGLP
jgi:hypothetical protein